MDRWREPDVGGDEVAQVGGVKGLDVLHVSHDQVVVRLHGLLRWRCCRFR